MTQDQALAYLTEIDKEITLLIHIDATVSWDQETYMPPAAVEEKSEQASLLSRLTHQRLVNDQVGEALEVLGAGPELLETPFLDQAGRGLSSTLTQVQKALVRNLYRDYVKNKNIPEHLVSKIAETQALSQNAWVAARKANDFSQFQPYLETMVDLKRQEAEAVGYEDHIYDALLDTYEPGMKTAEVQVVFDQLKTRLVALVKRIAAAPQIDDSFLQRNYPIKLQEAFGHQVLADLGYDMNRGRLDVTAHPFSTSLGRDDVRITTRYQEDFFKSGIFSIIHEAGHGLYELGFGTEIRGTGLADGTSLGIHESQSRTWENMIGRSRGFWDHYLPKVNKTFDNLVSDINLDQWYRGINKVEPSLIRVEADEVTYSLHIMARFTLETKLLSGEIQVQHLPELWNLQYRELLGIEPDTDANGVLQDIHWSFGLFGYFPTYALGNLIGAQFYEAMEHQLGGKAKLDTLIRQADFAPILQWLRNHIHQYGKMKTATELLKDIAGAGLDAEPFLAYLETKYQDVYGLA
jgi:carboxypeptidase Taq